MLSTKRRRAKRPANRERSASNSPRPHKSARKSTDEDKENNDPNTDIEPLIDHVVVKPHRGGSGDFSHETAEKKKPYDYICFHRPLFDVDSENWRKWTEGKEERLEKHEIYTKLYKPGHVEEDKKGIWAALPAQHKDHKWVIMRIAWLMFDGFRRRVEYCDPDNSTMHIYMDWKGWHMQDIVDHAMLDFDQAFKHEGGHRLEKMWVIMSAIGLWANVEDVTELVSKQIEGQQAITRLHYADSGDGEKDHDLVGLLGCALLTVLSAIDEVGELKSGSHYLDLALVIGNFLELSHDLPAYGIEGACVCWRQEAIRLFKKAKLDPKRALFNTEYLLKQLEKAPNTEHLNSDDETEDEDEANKDLLHHQHGTENDPWAWGANMERYKKKYQETLAFKQYDMTKLMRAERA